MGSSSRRSTIGRRLSAAFVVVILTFGLVGGSLVASNPSGTGQPS